MYAELNRLLVSLGQIPLYIELQQDNRTVCCSHTVVAKDLTVPSPGHTAALHIYLLHWNQT